MGPYHHFLLLRLHKEFLLNVESHSAFPSELAKSVSMKRGSKMDEQKERNNFDKTIFESLW